MQSQLHLMMKLSPTRSHRLLLICPKQKRRVRRLIPPELGDAPNGSVPRGREVRFALLSLPNVAIVLGPMLVRCKSQKLK